MRNKIRIWQLCGFIFTSVLGTVLHFAYEWSGDSAIFALFSGVNESVWEHMKLLYMPMLIFSFMQAPSFSSRAELWTIKLFGALLGTAMIPLLYWTYNGAIGRSPALVNIMIFYISAAVAYCFELYLFEKRRLRAEKLICLTVMLLIAAAFAVFTFFPPRIELFRDLTSGGYGI